MSTSTESVLRGPGADDATVVRFATDLRAQRPEPTELSERVRETARATGYAEGWSQGQHAAQHAARAIAVQQAARVQQAELAREAALRQALGAVAGAASRLERHAAVDLAALENLVLRAAVELAETLLGRELVATDSAGLDALRRAIALVPPDGPVTVLVNPEDYRVLTGGQEPECEQVHQGRRVTLRPDPGLAPGDAVAECAATTVDARLSSALDRVRQTVFG